MVSCCLVACVSLKISDKESSASPIVFDISNSDQIFPAVLKDISGFTSWLIEVQGLMKMYLHNIGLNLVVEEGGKGGGCS